MGAKKRQNKIWEYREMLLAWKRAKVMTWAGYILGFPPTAPKSIARDIETIKRELPIDILEFFFLTPLPGSEDHKTLHLKGAWMEADMNNYDLEHVCADHAIMPADIWRGIYRDAWKRYYSDAMLETVLRRAVASGISPRKITDAMTVFSGASRIERVHPLQFGSRAAQDQDAAPAWAPRSEPASGGSIPRRAWTFCQSRKVGRARVALSRDPAPRARRRGRRGLHGRGAEARDRGRPRA